ncbi:sigma-70 family RNA polymerase sigma factor [Planococcus shenhongbingii]|uniref:Sigma-70 family RNA polymerase sigma factor n=1 Tax=Planococcus shenhongbingii TaxID=3058398 RepID=A0ABT8N9I8_9BACL|nr:sigma-70 family RNA polymerase sigma factor [Planococcus sp. N017]MDN7244521.1 sigma-70 family RNA polymerase sigma factor [Planococcus sp. N017]
MKNFEEAIVQYSPMISAIIRKLHIYRDYETYKQVGKIALWQACLRFDETKGNFTPFAYRSIHGAMLDELKKETRFADRFTVAENEQFEWISDDRVTDELPEWIQTALLAEAEYILLEDLFVKGKSLRELASISGISHAGMKKRRERVLKKVKDRIAADIFD